MSKLVVLFVAAILIIQNVSSEEFIKLKNGHEHNQKLHYKRIPKTDGRGILDLINVLKQKIEDIIHLASHLPTSIEELPTKIQELLSHLNVGIITNKVEEEVNNILDGAGSGTEKCRTQANEAIHLLVNASETDAQNCRKASNNQVWEIKTDFSNLVDDAKKILNDINDQIFKCFLEHKLNLFEFYKCVAAHVEEYKQRITDLQKKVSDTVDHVPVKADEILQSLAKCVNDVQLSTVVKGQEIIASAEKCIKNQN